MKNEKKGEWIIKPDYDVLLHQCDKGKVKHLKTKGTMANDLIQFGETHKAQGMTSLEIAEVTGKHHMPRNARHPAIFLEHGKKYRKESNFGLDNPEKVDSLMVSA